MSQRRPSISARLLRLLIICTFSCFYVHADRKPSGRKDACPLDSDAYSSNGHPYMVEAYLDASEDSFDAHTAVLEASYANAQDFEKIHLDQNVSFDHQSESMDASEDMDLDETLVPHSFISTEDEDVNLVFESTHDAFDQQSVVAELEESYSDDMDDEQMTISNDLLLFDAGDSMPHEEVVEQVMEMDTPVTTHDNSALDEDEDFFQAVHDHMMAQIQMLRDLYESDPELGGLFDVHQNDHLSSSTAWNLHHQGKAQIPNPPIRNRKRLAMIQESLDSLAELWTAELDAMRNELNTPSNSKLVFDRMTQALRHRRSSMHHLHSSLPSTGFSPDPFVGWQWMRVVDSLESYSTLVLHLQFAMVIMSALVFIPYLLFIMYKTFRSVKKASESEPLSASFLLSTQGLRYLWSHFRHHSAHKPILSRRRFASVAGLRSVNSSPSKQNHASANMASVCTTTMKSFTSKSSKAASAAVVVLDQHRKAVTENSSVRRRRTDDLSFRSVPNSPSKSTRAQSLDQSCLEKSPSTPFPTDDSKFNLFGNACSEEDASYNMDKLNEDDQACSDDSDGAFTIDGSHTDYTETIILTETAHSDGPSEMDHCMQDPTPMEFDDDDDASMADESALPKRHFSNSIAPPLVVQVPMSVKDSWIESTDSQQSSSSRSNRAASVSEVSSAAEMNRKRADWVRNMPLFNSDFSFLPVEVISEVASLSNNSSSFLPSSPLDSPSAAAAADTASELTSASLLNSSRYQPRTRSSSVTTTTTSCGSMRPLRHASSSSNLLMSTVEQFNDDQQEEQVLVQDHGNFDEDVSQSKLCRYLNRANSVSGAGNNNLHARNTPSKDFLVTDRLSSKSPVDVMTAPPGFSNTINSKDCLPAPSEDVPRSEVALATAFEKHSSLPMGLSLTSDHPGVISAATLRARRRMSSRIVVTDESSTAGMDNAVSQLSLLPEDPHENI